MTEALGLKAAWTLVLNQGKPEIRRDAIVVVDGDRIAGVASAADPMPPRIVDLGQSLLTPGLINGHSHCVSGPLFRGVMEDRSYASQGEIIEAVMIPLGETVTELCQEDDIRKIAALGQLEILKAGATTIIDMPRAGHFGFGLAAREIGLRAYASPFLASPRDASWQWEDGADTTVDHVMQTFHRWHERFDEGAGGRVRIGLGPLAPDHCTPALLRAIARERTRSGVPLVVHAAQSPEEMSTIRARFGFSPIEYLDRVGILRPGAIAAHCVFAEPEDLRLLAARGVAIAHCPLAYARLGRMALRSRFTAQGVTTLVGSDAHALDLLADIRQASINSKYDTGQQGAASAWELVDSATRGAADVLGRSDLGRIAPGAQADLVAFRLDGAHVQPVDDPVKTLVWNGSGRDTSFVMVAGETLVQDGAFTRLDERRIVSDGAEVVSRVWSRAKEKGVI
jgi:5-methylthioadenosine/S-adenosylhomocysteine deaminase